MNTINTQITFEFRKYGADKNLFDFLKPINRNALIAWLWSKRYRQNEPLMQSVARFVESMHGEIKKRTLLTLYYRYVWEGHENEVGYKTVIKTLNETYPYPDIWFDLSHLDWKMCVEAAARIMLRRGENPRDVALKVNRSYAYAYRLRDKMCYEQTLK